MKKLLSIALLFSVLLFSACGDDDDDEPKKKCLVCEATTTSSGIIDGGTVCEGDIDPDSGETVTVALLTLAKSFSDQVDPSACKLIDQ
jgi:hypothetical protein